MSPTTPNSPEVSDDILGTVSNPDPRLAQSTENSVQTCSESVIEGSWIDFPYVRGDGRKSFIPATFESAKAFLRKSGALFPKEKQVRSSRSELDTPLSSKSQSVHRMDVCHGCHGPMGEGRHMGSAPGKNVCTLSHSELCTGGILENDSWRSCPPSYVFKAAVPVYGFENTMGSQEFQ